MIVLYTFVIMDSFKMKINKVTVFKMNDHSSFVRIIRMMVPPREKKSQMHKYWKIRLLKNINLNVNMINFDILATIPVLDFRN